MRQTQGYSWFAALTAALRKYASGIFLAQAAAAMPRGNRSASDAGLLLVRGVDDIHELVRLQGRAPDQAAVLPPWLKPRRGPLAHLTSSGGVNPPCGEVCFADPRTRSARGGDVSGGRRYSWFAALMISTNWSGFRDAPPIRPPSSRRG